MNLSDYTYHLPDHRIAKHPPKERGKSKLLVYKKGEITHHKFPELPDLLPEESTLVFNNTKVIPARIILHKPTGARIEVFLLEPLSPSWSHEEVMNATESCTWKCMIGNAKRWPLETTLTHDTLNLQATRTGDQEVTFQWKEGRFSELLEAIGKIPLPPYMNREAEEEDFERYQTIYSKMEGAVAAPTAGLHFTEPVMHELKSKDIPMEYLTLHVSAGTFQPIKTEDITQHPMHNEKIWFHRKTIESLLKAKKIIAVGTTSMRSLESLFWFGALLHEGITEFRIKATDPYHLAPPVLQDSLKNVLEFMDQNQMEELGGETEIFIYPGYEFQVCKGLITNYHLPQSTLILLVAAFIGEDWRRVYESALANDYQFLSYGDSSLLMK